MKPRARQRGELWAGGRFCVVLSGWLVFGRTIQRRRVARPSRRFNRNWASTLFFVFCLAARRKTTNNAPTTTTTTIRTIRTTSRADNEREQHTTPYNRNTRNIRWCTHAFCRHADTKQRRRRLSSHTLTKTHRHKTKLEAMKTFGIPPKRTNWMNTALRSKTAKKWAHDQLIWTRNIYEHIDTVHKTPLCVRTFCRRRRRRWQ